MTRPTTQAISPFFIVSNVDQTIAFYRDKLGFETRFRNRIETLFCHRRAATERRSSSSPIKTRRRCRTQSVVPSE
jgi:catechol 2,3-dioxygenase-like lactoylglutathione lyase family enzyme